eukprot:3729744-Pyramimonas_sp.AAC.1
MATLDNAIPAVPAPAHGAIVQINRPRGTALAQASKSAPCGIQLATSAHGNKRADRAIARSNGVP